MAMSISPRTFNRQIVPMLVISVLAWAAFAFVFRTFWPGSYAPGDELGAFWTWLFVGTAAFVGAMIGLFRWFETPAAWRTSAAVALAAPALCLDVLTTIFFERWFPAAGVGDDRIYPALVVGVVGALLLVSLLMTKPEMGAHAEG
jgi:hypothetical protein